MRIGRPWVVLVALAAALVHCGSSQTAASGGDSGTMGSDAGDDSALADTGSSETSGGDGMTPAAGGGDRLGSVARLRDRTADLPLLLDHFLRRFSAALEKDVRGISPQALDILLKYPWPGNIRELQNVVRQALLNTVGPVLLPEFLPAAVVNHHGHAAAEAAVDGVDLTAQIDRLLAQDSSNVYEETVAALERYVLPLVLHKTQGNISHSAKILGITRGSLRNKIRALGLSIDRQIKIDDGLADGDDADDAL